MPLCSCAAVLYILRCAPFLLAPLGVLSALLYLLLGVLLAVVGAGAAVVSCGLLAWPCCVAFLSETMSAACSRSC